MITDTETATYVRCREILYYIFCKKTKISTMSTILTLRTVNDRIEQPILSILELALSLGIPILSRSMHRANSYFARNNYTQRTSADTVILIVIVYSTFKFCDLQSHAQERRAPQE